MKIRLLTCTTLTIIISFAVVFVDTAKPVTAQGPGVKGPVVGPPVRPASFDGDVRRLPQVAPAERREMLRPLRPSPLTPQPRAGFKDPALQSVQAPLAMPTTSQNFKGLDFATWGAGWPPDTNGDVGPNHYIQAVNISIGIFNKTGTLLAAFTFDNFFGGSGIAGTPCDSNNSGDPVVLYDRAADRWVISDLGFADVDNGPYYECIAVSKTGDPVSGGWWMYAFRADDATHPFLNDYPKLGVWSDAYYMSANQFDCFFFCLINSFQGVRVWALDRASMLNGGAANQVHFDLSSAYSSLLPCNFRGGLPPSGSPNYFVSIDSVTGILNTLHVWKFHVDWNNPANSTFTGPTNVTVANFSEPSSAVPALNGTALDTLGDRLMMQNQY